MAGEKSNVKWRFEEFGECDINPPLPSAGNPQLIITHTVVEMGLDSFWRVESLGEPCTKTSRQNWHESYGWVSVDHDCCSNRRILCNTYTHTHMHTELHGHSQSVLGVCVWCTNRSHLRHTHNWIGLCSHASGVLTLLPGFVPSFLPSSLLPYFLFYWDVHYFTTGSWSLCLELV